jgi:hypothetical protein
MKIWRRLFPLFGERVREVVETNSIRRAQAKPRRGLEVRENRVAAKIAFRSALASGSGATAPKRPAATVRLDFCRSVEEDVFPEIDVFPHAGDSFNAAILRNNNRD